MSRWRSCVIGLALVAHAAGLAAREKGPAAFDQRCIPPGCVAPGSNTAGIFPRRALPDGHSTGLGATRDSYHELLAAERPGSVRLVEVTSESTAASQSVLITATAPASYTTRQVDPLTVLITLRDVAAGDVDTKLRPGPDDPVTSVEVRDAVDDDGNPVTQVRIGLREPTDYEVRSRRQTIQVRFARPVVPTPVPEDVALAPSLVGGGRPATALLSVGVEVEPDAISVTLYGNGALSPGLIHEAEHLPPRLILEFPHLAAEAASITPVEIDPVKQVRVAASNPELTRVVLDLVRPAVYHVEQLKGHERGLRVVFPRDRAVDPVAGIGGDPAWEASTAWMVEAASPALISAGPPLTGEGSNTVVAAGGVDAEAVARIEATAERRAQPDALGAGPPTSVAAPVDLTAFAPVTRLPGPVAVRVEGSSLRHPDLADLPRRPFWEGLEITRLDGLVAFIADTAPLSRPVPGDVPPRIWPEIPRLDGTRAAVDVATTPLLHPEAGDLPSRVDDAVLSATLAEVSPAVVAEVSPAETALRTTVVAAVVEPAAVEVSAIEVGPAAGVTPVVLDPVGAPETPEVPIAASRETEEFLTLSGSSRPTGAPSPRVAIQLPGQLAAGQGEYTGDPISMDFQNTDLRAVLRVFAEISGLSIVIDPSVQGEVNVALTQVPWDQAFDIILRTNQLDYEVDGTVVRIASVLQLAEEAEARGRLALAQENAGELVLYTRTLSYARAEDLVPLITNTSLSSNGQVFIDERTNTLIIRDLEDRLTTVSDLIDTLDRAEPQVEIEARIVQAGHDSARALGVQWGVTGRVAQEIGNTLPFSFPNRGGISGRVGAAEGQGPSGRDSRALPDENAGTVVNLGVGAATSALGLTLGSVNGSLNLDVILSALENEGELRIISSPRVMTQNNVEAEILQGDQIPYQTVANNTVTVQFKEAALTLRVTPQITASNTVIMQVELENSFPDFARALGDPPIPPIVTQRARTTVQVGDGETTVIGGIFENTQSQRSSRTPGLHRIPLLGWLFRNSDRSESTDELMIFITPQIVR